MAKKIYKYPLLLKEKQTITVKKSSNFLSAQQQGGCLCMWVLVDEHGDDLDVEVLILGTGQEVPENPGWFISTIQASNGLVWHVFIKEVV